MRSRDGFTFLELIVVSVLAVVIISASLGVLIVNQRVFTAQTAQIQGTQALRGAAAILTAELREVSGPLGDIVMMSEDSVRVRGQREYGIICEDAALGTSEWRALKMGPWLKVNDSVFVLADNNGGTAADDAWILTTIATLDSTATCYGDPSQQIVFADNAPFATDSVSSGALVRSFTHVTYGLMQRDSAFFLGRREKGGDWSPLVGPITSNGITFRYLDALGEPTTTATDVAQIEAKIRTSSDAVDGLGNSVADSLTIRIETRN